MLCESSIHKLSVKLLATTFHVVLEIFNASCSDLPLDELSATYVNYNELLHDKYLSLLISKLVGKLIIWPMFLWGVAKLSYFSLPR